MGFDEGQIILDSPNGVYYAGQTVRGTLVFEQDKVKTFRGIFLKMKGLCEVHWTTRHSRTVNGKSQSYTVSHSSNETYFERKVYLVGGESGEYHLNPGKHEFHFDCPIPANCPSSFDGYYGHIRYTIKAVVDRAFKTDQEKKVSIRVISPYDLNMDPYCKEPMTIEMFDAYCCCCTGAGSCKTLVKMPVAGYCPGQIIPIEVAVNNDSSVTIDVIKLVIHKNTTYHATHQPGTKQHEETIAKIKKGPVPGKTSRNWTVEMEVPAIDTYNVNSCRYIDIDYEFEVTVEASGCHDDSNETRRFVIGTIPLVGYQDNVVNPLIDQMPKQPIAPSNGAYPITNQPVPGANSLPSAPFPNPNSGYPGAPPSNQPYPGAPTGYPYPNNDQPTGYPGNLPSGSSPYPGGPPDNPPVSCPYPGLGPMPYPGSAPNLPGPGSSPNPPAPGSSPYPGGPPYPTAGVPPYPVGNPSPGHIGFHMPENKDDVSIPLMPPGAGVPYPPNPTPAIPYAKPSAPEPGTPDK